MVARCIGRRYGRRCVEPGLQNVDRLEVGGRMWLVRSAGARMRPSSVAISGEHSIRPDANVVAAAKGGRAGRPTKGRARRHRRYFCVPFGGALISASADSTHTAAKPEAHRSRRQNSAPHTMLWRPPKAVWTGYKPKKQDDH